MRGFGRRALQCKIGFERQRLFFSSQSQALLELQQQNVINGIFRRRMEKAGVSPRDRIAIAVSGGVDSMALCLLTLEWRKQCPQEHGGLIGFTVDDGKNATQVQKRLADIGIKCEILNCNHSEEQERGRYIILHDACRRQNIKILLAGHQADDLAETSIRRLSWCSDFTGLSSLPFVNELFPRTPSPEMKSLLVVKPLVDFYRRDLCEVCKRAGQQWIENKQQNLVAAPKIDLSQLSNSMRNEIQDLVIMCRKKRDEMEAEKNRVLRSVADVNMEYGYIVVNAEKLYRVKNDVLAARIVGAILRFIQQTAKTPRKRDVHKGLAWIRDKTKTNYRVGECSLCRLDHSKVLVTASPDSRRFSSSSPAKQKSRRLKPSVDSETEKAKFVKILEEPRKLRVISEATADFLIGVSVDLTMATNEAGPQREDEESGPMEEELNDHRFTGTSKYYMNRFFVTRLEELRATSSCRNCINGCCRLKSSLKIRQLTASDITRLEELDVAPEMLQQLDSLHENVRLGLPVVVTEDGNLVSVPAVELDICPNTKFISRFCPRFPILSDHMIWM